jgi:uncharacterized membrane protein YcaP (DUF421 family)
MMDSYLHIIVSTAAVYLFIVLALRIFGKTELAQLSVTDLIFVLLISNAVQNAMVGSDVSLTGGLIAASVLFVINFILKKVKYHIPFFRKVIEGEPIILVYNGKINERNCRENEISIDELLQTVREHGADSIMAVNSVILETDGNISVVSNDFKNYSVRKIKRKKNP